MKTLFRKLSILIETIEYQNVLYIGTVCLQLGLKKVKFCFFIKDHPIDAFFKLLNAGNIHQIDQLQWLYSEGTSQVKPVWRRSQHSFGTGQCKDTPGDRTCLGLLVQKSVNIILSLNSMIILKVSPTWNAMRSCFEKNLKTCKRPFKRATMKQVQKLKD